MIFLSQCIYFYSSSESTDGGLDGTGKEGGENGGSSSRDSTEVKDSGSVSTEVKDSGSVPEVKDSGSVSSTTDAPASHSPKRNRLTHRVRGDPKIPRFTRSFKW